MESFEKDVKNFYISLRIATLRAAAVAQYCGANAYYTLFSWLPYYFADTYPDAKGVVYNVVPSLAIVITAFFAPFIASSLFLYVHSLTLTRKLMEVYLLFNLYLFYVIPNFLSQYYQFKSQFSMFSGHFTECNCNMLIDFNSVCEFQFGFIHFYISHGSTWISSWWRFSKSM